MSREDIESVYPETLTIGAGVQCDVYRMPGQNAISFKYVSGGSLSIIGATNINGCTFATSQVYTLNATEVVNCNLMGTISLLASGSTVLCQVLRYKTPGT